jgi:hypothetical protein
MRVHYTVIDRRSVQVETGSGEIIDLSSSGLRFAAQRPLLPGLELGLIIEWPVLLNDSVRLQLTATGVVVWTRGTETAVRVHRHVFRTAAGA